MNVCDASNGRVRTFQWKIPTISSHDCSFPQLNESDFYSWHAGKMFQYQFARWIQRTDIVGRVRGGLEEIVWFSMKYIWGFWWKQKRKERIEKIYHQKVSRCSKVHSVQTSVWKSAELEVFLVENWSVNCRNKERKKTYLCCLFEFSVCHSLPSPLQCDSSLFILWLEHGQKVSENIIHQIKFIRQFMLEAAQTRL